MTISTVTIVGAGYMGGGIAQVLAMAGFDVTIADVSVDNANASLERLQKEARDFEEQGLYAPGSADLVAKNISAGKSIEEAVADVDFIEEAVFERIDVKRDVLGKISQHARPDAIIGTNTSTIPVSELESAVTNPERFLTVHFSNPAPVHPGRRAGRRQGHHPRGGRRRQGAAGEVRQPGRPGRRHPRHGAQPPPVRAAEGGHRGGRGGRRHR